MTWTPSKSAQETSAKLGAEKRAARFAHDRARRAGGRMPSEEDIARYLADAADRLPVMGRPGRDVDPTFAVYPTFPRYIDPDHVPVLAAHVLGMESEIQRLRAELAAAMDTINLMRDREVFGDSR